MFWYCCAFNAVRAQVPVCTHTRYFEYNMQCFVTHSSETNSVRSDFLQRRGAGTGRGTVRALMHVVVWIVQGEQQCVELGHRGVLGIQTSRTSTYYCCV